MRRVGKGFSRVDTPLFEGMLVQKQVNNDVSDDVADVAPTPPPLPHQSPIAPPSSPPQQQQPSQPSHTTDISMDLLNTLLETWGIIDDVDVNKDVTLEEVDAEKDAEVAKDAAVQGRLEESQAHAYHKDLEHVDKVLITAAATTITAAPSAVRRRNGEKELEEEASKALKKKSEISEEKAAKKQKLDEEMLWKIVQERFASSEPKNFLDDFLLNTLKAMFEKPNVEAHIWKNKKGSYGLAKVKSWKLLESCGVHIITFTTTQMILLVERRYHLTRFTLDQMLNNVRLEVKEESEVSLELLIFVRRQQQEGYRPDFGVDAVEDFKEYTQRDYYCWLKTYNCWPSDTPVCYLCMCEQCGNILNYGTCLNCNSGTGNSFTYDPIPESFDEILACCDDDDDYNSAITPNKLVDSLSMGDEHLDTILSTKSNEFIKSYVENLVPNPSESEGKNAYDMPACFTTFSNVLFDAEYEFGSVDDQSLSDEDFPEEIFSNPLFEEEINSMRIDQHHFNAESDLIESLLNHDSSIIPSSSKIDSLLDEFAGELTLPKSIPPRIDKTDCYHENEIRFIERLLYDNSSPRPPKEFVFENSKIESFSPSPIPIKESDSFMEEINLTFTPDDPMPSGIEEDDDDSRDILIREELLDNYSLSLPVIESFYFDIPSFSRPPAKPPDGNTRFLNIKMMGDIS
nr:hypothetical protein [Tanacetum cinerariifolium]